MKIICVLQIPFILNVWSCKYISRLHQHGIFLDIITVSFMYEMAPLTCEYTGNGEHFFFLFFLL